MIAFSKSYAGKLEEAKDLVEVAEKKEVQTQEMSEEQKIAEDKRSDYIEERVSVPPTRVKDPNMVDDMNNQAGPSMPGTTPRSSAQKSGLSMAGDEGDAKRLKLTTFKLVRENEGESSETKRQKVGDEKPHVERRVQATEVGNEVYGEEEFLSWDGEEEEVPSTMIPKELWSEAPLDRIAADPPTWIDDLADEVEEQRLLRMGVLEAMKEEKTGFKKLTTSFVRDWRVKPRQHLPDAPKQFLRRPRLVAREYAVDRRDDVRSPATGGQTLRLLPIIYLMKKLEERDGGDEFWLGSMDVKHAFLRGASASKNRQGLL